MPSLSMTNRDVFIAHSVIQWTISISLSISGTTTHTHILTCLFLSRYHHRLSTTTRLWSDTTHHFLAPSHQIKETLESITLSIVLHEIKRRGDNLLTQEICSVQHQILLNLIKSIMYYWAGIVINTCITVFFTWPFLLLPSFFSLFCITLFQLLPPSSL